MSNRQPAGHLAATAADEERFWSKVSRGPGCWTWTASLDRHGYGKFRLDGKMRRAHRVAFVLHGGELDPSLVLDHLCRNRACVNPDHLEEVPLKVNSLRGESPSARMATATHCASGHLFTEENTYTAHGRRTCRACQRAAVARYVQRKREDAA